MQDVPFVVIVETRSIVSCNPAAEEMFGRGRELPPSPGRTGRAADAPRGRPDRGPLPDPSTVCPYVGIFLAT